MAERTRWAAPATTVVTGAAGWLGQALMQRLLADEARRSVRVLVHHASEAALFQESPQVEVTVGDVADRAAVDRLFASVGAAADVVHAAGVIHPARVRDFVAVNVAGTRNVVDAARAAGVRRLVHVSSNSPFGTNPQPTDVFRNDEPYNPYYGYGQSKMEAEQAVFDAVDAGLDAVVVRPPWFYGPFQPPRQTTFFRMVRAGRFPVIGRGEQRRSMVYVDNLVDGLLLAELTVGARGNGYWIADARPYAVTEIVETVGGRCATRASA
jgi:nucleoside-diphosphate-sugar epimerase